MRKFIASNLLLLMFLVGAASGFLVCNTGWWGLHAGERDLNHLYETSTENLLSVSAIESNVLEAHELFLDILRKQQLSAADAAALAIIDAGLARQFDTLEHAATLGAQWRRIGVQYQGMTASRGRVLAALGQHPDKIFRLYSQDTLPLFNQLHQSLHQLAPVTLRAIQKAHAAAAEMNRNVRAVLLGLSTLASVFFCFIAWLTYRQAKEARKKSAQLDREHAMFHTLFDGTSDGIILLKQGRIIDSNRAATKLFALRAGVRFADLDLGQILPLHQPGGGVSVEALRSRLQEGAADDGRAQRFEWTFSKLDGRQFPGEVTIATARLGQDSIVQLMVRDITERKQLENDMMLATLAFENAHGGITITDENNCILSVNRAFSDISGYALDEVRGKNPSLLGSGRQSPAFYDEMWRAINEHGKWQGELWNLRKNGELYSEWLNISRVLNVHGKVSNYIGVFSDISERKAAEARLQRQTYYDELTDLPNRTLLTERLAQLFANAKLHPDEHFGIMFIDLDRLKVINDSLGREAGDQLLQMVAARLSGCLRETDTLARMTGDEFAILLGKTAGHERAGAAANKILRMFDEPFLLNGAQIHVALSIGVSRYPSDGADAESLLQNAAMAMFRAKTAGGLCYALYDEALGNAAGQRLALETGLRKAVERNEMELHYQPQYDCRSGQLMGFEALLRWRHPELGLIGPGLFLSVAEETGAIIQIGAWILKTACAQAQAWRRAGGPHVLMAVNLSARQLEHPDIVKHVLSALADSGLPPHCLELEITESMMIHKIDVSLAVMHQLSALGVEFSIDDFGTGYSSLAYLKKMPIKALKIDQSFIRDIVGNPDGAAIVSAIYAMSSTLGLRVIAEGIENADQLAHLQTYKDVIGQGYLLGRPVPATAAGLLIEQETGKAERQGTALELA
ncbi:MAG: EAL domain-containing protein [Burkholderiaceae bacterium]|nr:EAL domain-containing protein [Burkholderiaceae bacterium]